MSRMFVQTIPATAGNVVYNLSPSTGRRWKIHRWRITLVADANAANRIPRTRLYDDTALSNETGTPVSGATTTAGQTKVFSGGVLSAGTGASLADDAQALMNNPLVVDRAMSLSFEIINGLAGDSYSGYAVIEEEPSGS